MTENLSSLQNLMKKAEKISIIISSFRDFTFFRTVMVSGQQKHGVNGLLCNVPVMHRRNHFSDP